MLVEIINWTTVFTAIANIILISIPEEIFLVMFTLILLRQFEFLESKKERGNKLRKRDIFEIFIPVLFVAVLSNVLRYSGVDDNTILFTSIFSTFSLIVAVFKQLTISGILKTFFATIISFLIIILIEFTYIAIIIYITNKTASDLNNSIYLNFIISLPERVIEYSLIAYLLLKKTTFLKANFLNTIISSKLLSGVTLCVVLFNMIVFTTIIKLVWFDKILNHLSLAFQVEIIITILIFPIFNIVTLVGTVYYIKNREMYKNFITKEEMLRFTEDLLIFTKNHEFEMIKLTLKDMENNVHDMYNV